MLFVWLLLFVIILLAFLIPATGFNEPDEEDVYQDRKNDSDRFTFS
jgi:hypothetical protein